MSGVEEQKKVFVRNSLFQFITKNDPSADIDLIDDIVLSYVISILEESSKDPAFDIDGFREMMSVFMPNFECISEELVLSWFLELGGELAQGTEKKVERDNGDRISLTLQSLSEMLPAATKTTSRTNSESSESTSDKSEKTTTLDTELGEWSDKCRELHELFPNTTAMEIKHCISIAHGELQAAAATLLLRREQGQAPPPAPLAAPRPKPANDQELKNRIIARYSYVDKESGTKDHKPLAPKIEPKKMVRYRDNKIVSLKGERYTEVPKTGSEDEQLKKPKRQHCP